MRVLRDRAGRRWPTNSQITTGKGFWFSYALLSGSDVSGAKTTAVKKGDKYLSFTTEILLCYCV